MLLASDLRLEDAGAEISFTAGPIIRGILRGIAPGPFGMTRLVVQTGPHQWGDYSIDGDTLITIHDIDTELRIGGTPGRRNVWERANQVANLQLLMGAITTNRRDAR